MTHTENLNCPNCGQNVWVDIDNPTEYIKTCNNCLYKIIIRKSDYVNKFQCTQCNSLTGELEENDQFIAIRCKHCHTQIIVLEKHTDLNNRNNSTVIAQQSHIPICPRCGSTSITTGARGVNWKLGLIGASKTVNRCANCGHMWEPRK